MNTIQRLLGITVALCLGSSTTLHASAPLSLTLQGSAQVAFTPGDDAGALIARSIDEARRQILVQTYSFTHKAIAEALIAARLRGVDVQVLADPDQARTIRTSLIDMLVERGVTVYFDNQHAAAHNKVMIIDNGTPNATLITGSMNFTHAGQYRNAENLLILRGNPLLTEAYAANWRRHRTHSTYIKPPR